jgi:alpha-L-fucosidase
MGQAVHECFANPLAGLGDFDGGGLVWTALFEHPTLVDCVVIQEQLERGEHVRRFAIEALLSPRGDRPIKVYEGESIGHKAICRFPPLSAHGIRLRVLDADEQVLLRTLCVYDTGSNA